MLKENEVFKENGVVHARLFGVIIYKAIIFFNYYFSRSSQYQS